jgi:hypothetical protein
MTLTMPDNAIASVWRHVREYGAGPGVETGGFLITHRDDSYVNVVALTGEMGVLREPYRFGIEGEAIEQLAEWTDINSMLISAQFHSHRGAAFLSPIDKAGGYRIKGFVTAILPDFCDPPRSMDAWGWWQFEGNDWVDAAAPEVGSGIAATIVFDANGVRRVGG